MKNTECVFDNFQDVEIYTNRKYWQTQIAKSHYRLFTSSRYLEFTENHKFFLESSVFFI
jgi:hypothetical protein